MDNMDKCQIKVTKILSDEKFCPTKHGKYGKVLEKSDEIFQS